MLHARFDEMMAAEGAAGPVDLASRSVQLDSKQQKLLQAYYAGAIPHDLLQKEPDIAGSLRPSSTGSTRTTTSTPTP